MSNKMKAIVLKKFGNPAEMVVEERPAPVAKDGFTLVRMHSATMNQLSNTIRNGHFGPLPLPLVLANEGSGEVVESGRFKPGTRVAIYGGGELGISQDGLFQQWALVEDKRILELPDALHLDEGSALTVSYITAYLALTRTAKMHKGQTVLVSGVSGLVGYALVQVAKALGGQPIAAVSCTHNAERLRAAGDFVVIDLATQDLGEAVRNLTGGQGADVALDPVGGAVFGKMLGAVRQQGSLVSIGFAAGTEATVNLVDVILGQKSVVGFNLFAQSDETVSQALVEIGKLAAQGLVKPVVDSTVSLEDFEDGYSRLTSGKAVGAVIVRL